MRRLILPLWIACLVSCTVPMHGDDKTATALRRTSGQASSPSPASKPPNAPAADVVISHVNGSISRLGTIFKEEGDTVHVRVVDASRRCYSYNGSLRKVTEERTSSGRERRSAFNEVVNFEFEYTEPVVLEIEARLLAPNVPGCRPELERTAQTTLKPWEIRFATRGWDLAFSGGFTVDTLANPEFGLVPGKFTQPGETTATDGFFIQRFGDNESNNRLDTAAMVTLFHTDPHLFRRLRLNWAPFTFGMGAGENSALRFYFGTGVRAANKLFLNIGVVGGPVQRLKNGMSTTKNDRSSFTTDPNALNGLPTRTAFGAYIGVSYSFIGVGADAFRGRFQPQKPTPTDVVDQAGNGQDSGGGNAVTQPLVEFGDPEASEGNDKVYTYTIDVTNPPSAAKLENATFMHQPHSAATTTTWTCVTIKGAADTPCATPASGTGKITRIVTLDPDQTMRFDLKTTFPVANPAAETLTATLTGGSITTKPATTTLPPAGEEE